MTRQPPLDDWVVYAVVLSTVAAMMFGKYLMGKGDKPIEDTIKEDLTNDIIELEHEIEEVIEETLENIERKLNVKS